MTTGLVQNQNQTSGSALTKLSTECSKTLAYLAKEFDVPPRITAAEAQEALDYIEAAETELCSMSDAVHFAKMLCGCIPISKGLDPAFFVPALAKYLESQPRTIVRKICDPVKGLPTTQIFELKIADVATAVGVELKRRDTVIANAKWVLVTEAEKQRKAAEDAEWEKQHGSMADRAAQVERLLKGIVRSYDMNKPTELDAARKKANEEAKALGNGDVAKGYAIQIGVNDV